MAKSLFILLSALLVACEAGFLSNLLTKSAPKPPPQETPEQSAEFQQFLKFMQHKQNQQPAQVQEERDYPTWQPPAPDLHEPLFAHKEGEDGPVRHSDSEAQSSRPDTSKSLIVSPFSGLDKQPQQGTEKLLSLGWTSQPEVVGEKMPSAEDDLRYVLKNLFVYSDSLTPEEALAKLEFVEPFYEKIKTKLPIDTRKMISFSQDAEEHCNDRDFFNDMLSTQRLVRKEHRALESYISECIHSFQEVCDVESNIIRQWASFEADHEKGLEALGEIQKYVASYKKRDLFRESNLAVAALNEFMSRQEGIYNPTILLRETCESVEKFAVGLHEEAFNENWKEQPKIKSLLDSLNVCRKLAEANHLGHLHNEILSHTDRW